MKHSMFLYRLYAYAIYGQAIQLAVSRRDSQRSKEYPIFNIKITGFSRMVFVSYLDVGVDLISGRRHFHFLLRQYNLKHRLF